ncbi:unnamed protein product [Arctogadus glacialis]
MKTAENEAVSASSPRARPPPPVRSPPEQLKCEAEWLGSGGLWCQGGTEAGDQGPTAPDQRNVFLERRRAGRGAVNLEDDHHSTNKDFKPGLWLRRADGGAKTLEDDITPPTRILESGGLMKKPYIWKANPEDHQDSTIKDSSSSEPRPPEDLLSSAV